MIDIPYKFLIIDPVWIIDSIKSLFEQIGVIWVSEPITEQQFVVRMGWKARYNYLYPIIQHSFGKIIESGIPNKWNYFHRVFDKKFWGNMCKM